MMLVKIHKSYRTTVAICDSDLLEKNFEQEDREIKITKNFFGGEEKTPEEVKKIMLDYSAEDATFNLVGKETINLALKIELVKKEGITTIQNIPLALVLL